MLIAYKIVIVLTAIMHVIGFGMGVFFPAFMAKQFGVEYNEGLHRMTVHFGLLLMIFSAFLILAAYWTFGVIGGWCMTIAAILDLVMVGQGVDIPLIVMGLLTTLTAHLALKG